MFRKCSIAAIGIAAAWSAAAFAADPARVIAPDTREDRAAGIETCSRDRLRAHNPGLVGPYEIQICYDAFVVSFMDRDGDGPPRRIPHFVAYRIERTTDRLRTGNPRPPSWFTVPELEREGLAATDRSYAFTRAFRDRNPDWYERGHLAAKNLAERRGTDAGWFTHTTANAVPQRGRFNKTGWLDLECRTGAWASQSPSRPVWVITGPVFLGSEPKEWLRAPDGKTAAPRPSAKNRPPPVAVPDALFKVVVRRNGDGYEALGFLFPQRDKRYAQATKDLDASGFLESLDRIEQLTGLKFFPDVDGRRPAGTKASRLWPHRIADFDAGCRKFAKEA